MDLLDRMLGHDQWTTARYLELSEGLTDGQLDQPFDIGQGNLRATLEHMIWATDLWRASLSGQPVPREPHDQPTIAQLTTEHARVYPAFAEVARRAQAEGRLDDVFIDYFNYPQSVGATIINVILHNAQHRGEVRHMLQRLGVPHLPDGDPQEWEHWTGPIQAPPPDTTPR